MSTVQLLKTLAVSSVSPLLQLFDLPSNKTSPTIDLTPKASIMELNNTKIIYPVNISPTLGNTETLPPRKWSANAITQVTMANPEQALTSLDKLRQDYMRFSGHANYLSNFIPDDEQSTRVDDASKRLLSFTCFRQLPLELRVSNYIHWPLPHAWLTICNRSESGNLQLLFQGL